MGPRINSARATTPKLLLQAALREGRRQRYPGEIARAPSLPCLIFSADARAGANARLILLPLRDRCIILRS